MITESPFPIKGHSKLVFRFVFLSDASTHSHLPLLFQAFPATPFSVQFHNPTGPVSGKAREAGAAPRLDADHYRGAGDRDQSFLRGGSSGLPGNGYRVLWTVRSLFPGADGSFYCLPLFCACKALKIKDFSAPNCPQ